MKTGNFLLSSSDHLRLEKNRTEKAEKEKAALIMLCKCKRLSNSFYALHTHAEGRRKKCIKLVLILRYYVITLIHLRGNSYKLILK